MGSSASVQQTNLQSKSALKETNSDFVRAVGQDPVKILIVGDSRCGKTAIFLRYVKNQFYASYWPTMEAQIDTVVRKVNVPSSELVSIQLWDIPGDEDINLFDQYCRDVHAVIVVVDASRPESVRSAVEWKQKVVDCLTFSDAQLLSEEESTGSCAGEVQDEQAQVESHQDQKPSIARKKEQILYLLAGSKADLVPGLALSKEKSLLKSEVERSENSNDTVEANKRHVEKQNSSKINPEKKLEKVAALKTDKTMPEPQRIEEFDPGKREQAQDHVHELDAAQQLQSTAEENGFVTSVLVSSRLGDHSVHTAVQSLVRRVVEQRLQRSATVTSEPTEEQQQVSPELKHCGLQEFDELFDKASVPLRWAAQCEACCALTLNELRASCVSAELLTAGEASSLQACVQALNQALRLKVKNDEPFLQLEFVTAPNEEEINSTHIKALDCFNKEFAALRKSLLTDGPGVDLALRKLDVRLSARAESSWEPQAVERGLEARNVLSVLEKNRARLLHTSQLLEQRLQEAVDDGEKIRTALLW